MAYTIPIAGVRSTGEEQDSVLPALADPGPIDGTITCDVGLGTVERPFAESSFTAERDSTGWVDATTALLAIDPDVEYVQLGYSAEGGPAGGWTDCDTEVDASTTGWSVTMVGFGALDLIRAISLGVGPDLPANPVNGHITGAVLRPTALTWPGQDPANTANRSLWDPSEVASLHDAFTMTNLTAYDIRVTVSAVGFVKTGMFMCIV